MHMNDYRNADPRQNPRPERPRKDRISLTGRLIRTGQGDGIVVKFELWIFKISMLVNIPYEGEETAPAFIEVGTTMPPTTSNLVTIVPNDPMPRVNVEGAD